MKIIKIAQNSDSVWVDSKGAPVWSSGDEEYGQLNDEQWEVMKRHPSFNIVGDEIVGKNNFRFHPPFHEFKDGYTRIKGQTREEFITTTKDVEFLRKVLAREEDDYASCYAVLNPICPKELLEKVILDPEMERTVEYIAQRKDCPPEMLDDIITRDFNSWAAQLAVRNPSCSPEVITRLLSHGTKHSICFEAVANPNCPIGVKMKLLEDTGQIHQGPEEQKKERYNKSDADLEELRNLFNGERI